MFPPSLGYGRKLTVCCSFSCESTSRMVHESLKNSLVGLPLPIWPASKLCCELEWWLVADGSTIFVELWTVGFIAGQ